MFLHHECVSLTCRRSWIWGQRSGLLWGAGSAGGALGWCWQVQVSEREIASFLKRQQGLVNTSRYTNTHSSVSSSGPLTLIVFLFLSLVDVQRQLLHAHALLLLRLLLVEVIRRQMRRQRHVQDLKLHRQRRKNVKYQSYHFCGWTEIHMRKSLNKQMTNITFILFKQYIMLI